MFVSPPNLKGLLVFKVKVSFLFSSEHKNRKHSTQVYIIYSSILIIFSAISQTLRPIKYRSPKKPPYSQIK